MHIKSFFDCECGRFFPLAWACKALQRAHPFLSIRHTVIYSTLWSVLVLHRPRRGWAPRTRLRTAHEDTLVQFMVPTRR
jgi:hypothetical protein